MSELLQIIVDLNVGKLNQDVEGTPPLQVLFDSLIKFLNAFQIASAVNRYRILVAMPNSCHLIFPLDDIGDNQLLQKFEFKKVRETIYERVGMIIH